MKLLIAAAAVAALGASLGAAPAGARTMSSMAMPTCAAGDKVVWVNTRSKVYYEPGGAYYGKTKHGKYVCESAATSMGMHMAKSGMMHDANGMSSHHGMMGHHAGMMKHHTGMMHGNANAMGSGSMGSSSMGSGTMKPGTMAPTPMASGAMSPPASIDAPPLKPTTSITPAGTGSLVTPVPLPAKTHSN